MMKKGLVLGKFMPLHKGHLALIDFALQHCEHVIVMLCVSDKEPINGPVRKSWLDAHYREDTRVQIALAEYDEAVLPNSSVSSRSISALWAAYIRDHFPGIEVFVSSEPYGEYVAEYLGIVHHCFQPAPYFVGLLNIGILLLRLRAPGL
jgi:HTH-type transcriptional regulator, transcriptional repressor of NAD biosynthesis genes